MCLQHTGVGSKREEIPNWLYSAEDKEKHPFLNGEGALLGDPLDKWI